MAQIVTITNPLTGQPAQVDQLDHTAQQIDDAIARALPSTDYPGCYYRMVDGVTEWVNPPMVVSIEYRTTERYQGKAVYAKLVNCGTWSAGKRVEYIASAELDTPVSVSVQQGGNITYPYINNNQYALLLQNNVYLGGTEDSWGGTVYALVKYTRAE